MKNVQILKMRYDIQNCLLSNPNISKLITTTFILNLKELQDKYLSFVQRYIYEELEHVNENAEECLRMIENVTTI